MWDIDKEAQAVQERQSKPAVSAAIDPRAFEITHERYNDECTQALI